MRAFPKAEPEMVALYEDGKQSTMQIASTLGIPQSRVRAQLLKAGVILRKQSEALKLRGDALSKSRKGKRFTHSAETRSRISEARTKWGEMNAVGVSIKPNGYEEYTRGEHKFRSVHTVKMEGRIGRRLLPDEVVHHIDGDRKNNTDDNLALMTRAAHTRLHRREQRLMKGKQ
jgi:hypothetical protein